MASIGSLTADLRLESASFIRNLNKAAQETARNTSAMQRHMAGLNRSFAAAGQQVRAFVAGFVSVAAVRGLANLGRAAIQAADDVGAAATRIGVAADELQKLRFGAAQVDVEVTQLDRAFARFSAQLAKGQIEASGQNMAEAFRDYIRQIAEAPTHLEKIRIAQAALGTRGFQTGIALAEAYKQFNAEAEMAFAFSNDALNAASKLDNEFRSISNAIQVGFGTGFLEAFNDGLGTTKEQLESLNTLGLKFGAVVGGAFREINKTITSVSGAIKSINRDLESLPPEIKALIRRIGGQSAQSTLAPLTFGDWTVPGSSGPHPRAGMGLGSGVDETAVGRQQKFSDSLGRTVEQTRALIDAAGQGNAAFTALQDRLEATNDVIRQGVDANSALGQSLIQLGVEARQLDRELALAEDRMTLFSDLAQAGLTRVADSFTDAVIEAKKFSDVLDSLLKDLARLVMNAAFQQIIGQAGTSSQAGSGIMGALFHKGGIVGQTPTSMRLVSPEVFASAQRYHSGGIAGLRANEVPAILERGERVIAKNSAAIGAPVVNVSIIEAPGKGGESKQTTDSNGALNIEMYVDQLVAKSMARPGAASNQVLQRMGAALPGTRR